LANLPVATLVGRLLDPDNHAPENPNPLFDAAYVVQHGPRDRSFNPILAVLTDPRLAGLWPHPLFCPAAYRQHRRAEGASLVRLLAMALEDLDEGLLRGFHPMVDIDHLARICSRASDRAFLVDLFNPGFPTASPHPRVEPGHVAATTGLEFATLGGFLDHYRRGDRDLATQPLIDPDHYRQTLGVTDPGLRSTWH